MKGSWSRFDDIDDAVSAHSMTIESVSIGVIKTCICCKKDFSVVF